jgi:crotonobetainyl-CoA:carnitine CoA-transferase CaiB-like acyl-CoA transferase
MRPLDGVRVVEASSYVTGPFAALALADLGATVVKVEPPRGDPMRRFGVRHRGDGVGFGFAATNRNKTSVTLDLKTEAGLDGLHELLSTADAFVTNWRPAVATRLGLTPPAVRGRHPRLVWVRLSGYGQDGPLVDFPAFDGIVQARSGVVAGNGDPPRLVPGYLADKVTAMTATQSVLAAIVHRDRSGDGAGAVVDVSMLDAMAYFLGPDLFGDHLVVDEPEPGVARHAAASRPLRTGDGWIVLAPVSGAQIKGALGAVGHPEWGEQLRAAASAVDMIERFHELVGTVLPTRTTSEWERAFADADVPASAVLSYAAHLADPQVVHNRTYHETDDPTLGRARHLRYPALFDGTPTDTDDLPVPPLD